MQASYFCPYCPGIRYTLSSLRGLLYCSKCSRVATHQPYLKKLEKEKDTSKPEDSNGR